MLITPSYWEQALEYLSTRDKRLAVIITSFADLTPYSRGNAFVTLARAVVGQQISVKAATSVWGNIELNIGVISYKNILKQKPEALRKCGLSKQKVSYIINIANYFHKHNINDFTYWQHKNYTNVKKELIAIKGVGIWTIEMFAIFYLLEPDIFPIKDLGLQRAIKKLYKKSHMSIDEIDKISCNWKPYRTVATWFLWRFIDDDLVVY